MKDKNSLIGFALMAIIMIVFYLWFIPEDQAPSTAGTQATTTETQPSETTTTSTLPEINESASEELKTTYGIFATAAAGIDGEQVLETKKLKITVANKGGRITSAIIKEGPNGEKYKKYNSLRVKTQEDPSGDSSLALDLFDANNSKFNLKFSTGKTINTSNLYFEGTRYDKYTLSMKVVVGEGQYIEYLYKLKDDDYLVDFDINFVGMEDVIAKRDPMNLEWQMKTPQTEKSKTNQDMYTGIHYQYRSTKEVDYVSFSSDKEEKTLDERSDELSWVAFKQQFFSAIFISKGEDGFNSTTLISEKNPNIKEKGIDFIKDLSMETGYTFKNETHESLKFQFYFGPNHYKTLESYNSGFEELIYLGFMWIDTLVNKYIIMNLFDFLSKHFSSYGLIILLLTLIIKLCLSPFTYKAFLSQAKMKVLKPEIDKINEKHKKKDPMKAQKETMGLYRKAGVNPMGGCLPMLFQFPILIALFRFFPASIELRQESFLWADDLSAYDSIELLTWGGDPIWILGNHLSVFTILMTISTLLYTKMNSSMATGQMAQMKWIMYLMPIMFLGFFNDYAAGLTYYYFLANMFTFSQQYLMRRFIDEDAILAQLEANKLKPSKPKSKFQKKLEEMQNKQEQQKKNRKKR